MKLLLLAPCVLVFVAAAPYDIVVKLGKQEPPPASLPSPYSSSSQNGLTSNVNQAGTGVQESTDAAPLSNITETPLSAAHGVSSPNAGSASSLRTNDFQTKAASSSWTMFNATRPPSSPVTSDTYDSGASGPTFGPDSAPVSPPKPGYASAPAQTYAIDSSSSPGPAQAHAFPGVPLISTVSSQSPVASPLAVNASAGNAASDSANPLPQANITISFKAMTSSPSPPQSPISYTYIKQTSPPTPVESPSPPPRAPPAPLPYASPVAGPSLSSAPETTSDSTQEPVSTASPPTAASNTSLEPPSTSEPLFPVLNNSLIVVQLSPDEVTSQDGKADQTSHQLKSPAPYDSSNGENSNSLVSPQLSSGGSPVAPDSYKTNTSNNIHTNNTSAETGNDMLKVPTALLEHIHGSQLSSSVTSDKSSDNSATTHQKPTHAHVIQIAHVALSRESQNGNKANSSVSSVAASASVAEQNPHSMRLPVNLNSTKENLDSPISVPVSLQLGIKETKAPTPEHQIAPPAKAPLNRAKWGFGDKYLASQNQRARHRNVMFDGIAGDSSSFSNYQVLGHQDLLFKRSKERRERDAEETAAEPSG